MNKVNYILTGLFVAASLTVPNLTVHAAELPVISRTAAEQRALNLINLTWTYDSSKNGTISPNYSPYVTKPNQLNGVTNAQMTGIPYDWGAHDSLDSYSYGAPWTNFLDAVNKGAFIGNVNTSAGYGLIPGTAGIDCSGFVQAVFNIPGQKISTYTLLDTDFKRIDLSEIKHMDILDRPGDHVLIFDKWGTLNGVQGAFTYEATWDQIFGGIQGTKRYFVTMDDINNGYIPARYVGIVDDSSTSLTNSSSSLKGTFGKISNVNYYANFRSNPFVNSSLLGTIPKDTVLYLIDYSSGWYQVNYNGQVGWVSGSLIASIPSGEYVAINNAYMLNIRSNPSSTASIIGVLGQNQYAHVIDYSNDGNWFKISINGIQGWASRNYLKYIY